MHPLVKFAKVLLATASASTVKPLFLAFVYTIALLNEIGYMVAAGNAIVVLTLAASKTVLLLRAVLILLFYLLLRIFSCKILLGMFIVITDCLVVRRFFQRCLERVSS